jgi:hypothetical protein
MIKKPWTVGAASKLPPRLLAALERVASFAARLAPYINPPLPEGVQDIDEEIQTYRALGDDLNQPIRLLRLPLWARIAHRHGDARGALDYSGRVIYTGPRGRLRAYHEASGIQCSYKSFLKAVVDENGKPFSYRSGITTGPLVSLPYEIEKEFEKAKKVKSR